jgi:hypothetical protein
VSLFSRIGYTGAMADEPSGSHDFDRKLEAALRRVISESRWPIIVVRDNTAEVLDEVRKLRHACQGARCRFAEGEGDGLLRMLTGGGDRQAPLKDLRAWLKGATEVTVADPYFFHGDTTGWNTRSRKSKKQAAERYAADVNKVLGSVKRVTVYHLPDPPKTMVTALKRLAWRGRKVHAIATTEIHDRVWIRDDSDARLIGTSFGSIGKKIAFMLELPSDDRISFVSELRRIRGG